jgi:hypothetical protein
VLESTIIGINLTKSSWVPRKTHPIERFENQLIDGILLAEKVKKEEGVQGKLEI